MAKTSLKVKQSRPAKFSTREYTRCEMWPSTLCIEKV